MRETGLVYRGSSELKHNAEIRENVCRLESAMMSRPEFVTGKELEQVAPINHYHCKGNYAREVFIQKGHCMIGKIHKHEHINVLSQGKCIVVTEDGRETLKAPLTFISKAGIKRAVYAIEDIIWTTIHPTEQTEVDKIEDEVIAKSYNELEYIL